MVVGRIWWEEQALPGKVPRISDDLPLVDRLRYLTQEVRALADLPAGDPRRKEAQKITKDAMALFVAITKLSLPFPKEFQTMLDKMDMLAGIMGD